MVATISINKLELELELDDTIFLTPESVVDRGKMQSIDVDARDVQNEVLAPPTTTPTQSNHGQQPPTPTPTPI